MGQELKAGANKDRYRNPTEDTSTCFIAGVEKRRAQLGFGKSIEAVSRVCEQVRKSQKVVGRRVVRHTPRYLCNYLYYLTWLPNGPFLVLFSRNFLWEQKTLHKKRHIKRQP